jgi:glycosyltransferase involved in cell wall biosynthesis
MARIVIADDTTAYTGETGSRIGLGGTETSVIQLASALARRGHSVTVLTRTEEHIRHDGVEWAPLAMARAFDAPDLYLPVQHPRLFGRVRRPRRLAVWLIWPINNLRHYKRFPVMWRYRPQPVVASAWQAKEYPRLVPGHPVIIPLAVQEEWRNQPPLTAPPAPEAIYSSMPGRGLPWLLPVWEQRILPRVPGARLNILGIKKFGSALGSQATELPGMEAIGEAGRASLRIHPTLSRPEQREVTRNCRVLLYHGHKSEAFCLAVAEAQALGVPAVVGSVTVLPERVRDGVTGFIRDDPAAFAEAAVKLLTDDALWRQFHEASLRLQQGPSWDEVAGRFEREILR